MHRYALVAAALAAALLLAACGSSGDGYGPSEVVPGALAPDFTLVDQNPVTPTHMQDVSPRDHLGAVSVWYFGTAT